MHHCWLHKIRMGNGSEDAEWQEKRLLELVRTQTLLFKSGHLIMILNLCVNDQVNNRQIDQVREGFGSPSNGMEH